MFIKDKLLLSVLVSILGSSAMPIELNKKLVPIFLKESTLKELHKEVDEVLRRRIRDRKWGRSSLIREIVEKYHREYFELLLKEG